MQLDSCPTCFNTTQFAGKTIDNATVNITNRLFCDLLTVKLIN